MFTFARGKKTSKAKSPFCVEHNDSNVCVKMKAFFRKLILCNLLEINALQGAIEMDNGSRTMYVGVVEWHYVFFGCIKRHQAIS